MSSFDGCWKRIERAGTHLDAFNRTSKGFFHDHGPTFSFDLKHDGKTGGTGVAKVAAEKPTDLTLSLILGEFFYQLRAALDGAFWEASVIVSRPNPPVKVNRVEFPICPVDDGKFEDSTLYKNPFPEQFRQWVELIQPYNAAKTSMTEYAGLNVALDTIHRCARFDRHRHLHVLAVLPVGAAGKCHCVPPVSITYMRPVICNLLEDKAEFMTFGIEGWDGHPDPQIYMEGHLDIEISVKEVPVPRGGNLGDELERLRQAAGMVVYRFEEAFG